MWNITESWDDTRTLQWDLKLPRCYNTIFQQRWTIYSNLGLEFNIRIFPNKLKTIPFAYKTYHFTSDAIYSLTKQNYVAIYWNIYAINEIIHFKVPVCKNQLNSFFVIFYFLHNIILHNVKTLSVEIQPWYLQYWLKRPWHRLKSHWNVWLKSNLDPHYLIIRFWDLLTFAINEKFLLHYSNIYLII